MISSFHIIGRTAETDYSSIGLLVVLQTYRPHDPMFVCSVERDRFLAQKKHTVVFLGYLYLVIRCSMSNSHKTKPEEQ